MSIGFDSANAESSRTNDFVFRAKKPGAEALLLTKGPYEKVNRQSKSVLHRKRSPYRKTQQFSRYRYDIKCQKRFNDEIKGIFADIDA